MVNVSQTNLLGPGQQVQQHGRKLTSTAMSMNLDAGNFLQRSTNASTGGLLQQARCRTSSPFLQAPTEQEENLNDNPAIFLTENPHRGALAHKQ